MSKYMQCDMVHITTNQGVGHNFDEEPGTSDFPGHGFYLIA